MRRVSLRKKINDMTKPYTGDPTDTCPYRGGRLCAKVCPTCKFQSKFTVTDNRSGAIETIWDCAIAFQTQLALEGNLMVQSVSAEIGQFRNETARRSDALLGGAVRLAHRTLEGVVEIERKHGEQRILPAHGAGAKIAALPSE